MKNLLVVTALLEIITGLALIVSPALPVSLLIGAALDDRSRAGPGAHRRGRPAGAGPRLLAGARRCPERRRARIGRRGVVLAGRGGGCGARLCGPGLEAGPASASGRRFFFTSPWRSGASLPSARASLEQRNEHIMQQPMSILQKYDAQSAGVRDRHRLQSGRELGLSRRMTVPTVRCMAAAPSGSSHLDDVVRLPLLVEEQLRGSIEAHPDGIATAGNGEDRRTVRRMLKAPAALLPTRARQLRTVFPAVRIGRDRGVGRHGMALCEYHGSVLLAMLMHSAPFDGIRRGRKVTEPGTANVFVAFSTIVGT